MQLLDTTPPGHATCLNVADGEKCRR